MNSQMHQEKVLNIKEVQNMWNGMVPMYQQFDSAPQSFYYSLMNILDLQHATSILDVGCGRCLLLPMTLMLKAPTASYLATDLSPKMIEAAHHYLQSHLKLYDSKLTYEEWLGRNKVTIGVANGEEAIQNAPTKFDRIICNMVLMLTEDPSKMLASLHAQAEQGCLLGLSVWGDRELNLVHSTLDKVLAKFGVEPSKVRSNFHLYNKVAALADPIGWKLQVTWEQVSVFPYLSSQGLQQYARSIIWKMSQLSEERRQEIFDEYMRVEAEILDSGHRALTFPAQLYVFRKQ